MPKFNISREYTFNKKCWILQKDLQQRKSPQVRKEQETEIEILFSFIFQHFYFLRNISVISAKIFLLQKILF